MASTENLNCRMQEPTSVERGISTALLESEIGFWQELIESCGESDSPESIERMRYALALAETRLARNPSNVYHLNK